MYEEYTRQALPSKEYRELLGTALCVFNSNNSFVIENILRLDDSENYNWYDLIDKTSGQIKRPLNDTITAHSDNTIAELFDEIVQLRNRILHSFQITSVDGEQVLATKDHDNNQYIITKEFLFNFIEKNQSLSSKLHELRGF